MNNQGIHVVTGAFGYSGKYIAKRLLARSYKVITLTNSPHRENPFGGQVQAFPFNFDKPDALTASLKGVEVLYNTYWVRFNHQMFTHADAVRNTRIMFQAAKEAGVERIVHLSVTNASEDSHLEYFRRKATLEKALKETGVSHAILRPGLIFGKEDILINNIVWLLRRFPVFGIFGDGRYRLQPIYVDDLAELAVELGETRQNVTINAIGPETFTYRELIEELGRIIRKNRPIISVPPALGYYVGWVVGKMANDIMITREEIKGLMAELLYVDSTPLGSTKLTDWAKQHADTLGLKYTSEMARRRDRETGYKSN